MYAETAIHYFAGHRVRTIVYDGQEMRGGKCRRGRKKSGQKNSLGTLAHESPLWLLKFLAKA